MTDKEEQRDLFKKILELEEHVALMQGVITDLKQEVKQERDEGIRKQVYQEQLTSGAQSVLVQPESMPENAVICPETVRETEKAWPETPENGTIQPEAVIENAAVQSASMQRLLRQPQPLTTKSKQMQMPPQTETQTQPTGQIPPPALQTQPTGQTLPQDFERRFGQNIMGIIASVMIFISFILFVSFVYNRFGDIVKAGILYTISFCLTGLGILFHKKSSNAFSKALSSCGIGACYISVLVSYFQLHLIGQAGMYVLIAVWLTAAAFLSKKLQTSSAALIGQIGITISVLLGSFQLDAIWKVYMLLVFVVGSSLFYQLLFKAHHRILIRLTIFLLGYVACISYGISIKWRFFTLSNGSMTIGQFIPVIIILIISFFLWYVFYQKTFVGRINAVVTGVMQLVQALVTIGMAARLIGLLWDKPALVSKLLILGVIICFWVVTEWLSAETGGRIAAIVCCAFYAADLIPKTAMIFDISGYTIVWLPALAYGFWKRDRVHQIIGIVFQCLHTVLLYWWFGDYHYMSTVYLLFGLIAIMVIMYYQNSQYCMGYKIASYLCLLLTMFILTEQIGAGIANITGKKQLFIASFRFFSLVIVNTAALKTKFIYDWNEPQEQPEKALYIICRGIAELLWTVGLILLLTDFMKPVLILLIPVMVALALIDSRKLMMEFGEKDLAGVYICTKATITAWAICEALAADINVVLSIVFLLLAIAFILAGFRAQMKSFRIYGLILSMLGVVKLLLFDIQYSDTLPRVAAFFVSGILCFVINFIYNYLSKRFEAPESGKENGN